ncbi:MAG: hypothetical protein JNL90_01550 [Planctomycetes bacterium]|nr:hypothetical protein [Planctomycetota bacterium]
MTSAPASPRGPRATSLARERRRFLAAALLLAASCTALAWLPALSTPSGKSVALLAALAGAPFLALATLALRALRHERRGAPLLSPLALVGGALLLRALVVAAPPWLSDDLWRYLFEGRVQRAGFSPYVHAPDDPALAALRDELHGRVTYRDIPAVYPPAAQLLFRWLPESALAWKAFVALLDLAFIAWMVRRLARSGQATRALLYAWNPLVVLEGAASGHLDLLGWCAALLALHAAEPAARRIGAHLHELAVGALAGLAGMVKPQGFVAALALLRPLRPVALLGTLLAALLLWLPFARDGSALFAGTLRYAHDWEFNGLCYPPLVRLGEQLKESLEALPDQPLHLWRVREIGYAIVPNQWARKVAALLFLALVALLLRRWRGRPLPLAFFALAAFVATTPVVHPWYVAWLAPFLPFLPARCGRFALLLTVTVLFAHAVPAERLASGQWREPPWIALLTWWPPCLLFAFDSWRGHLAAAAAPPAVTRA